MADSIDPLRECASLVRREEHDRYLTVLYAKSADQPTLFALYAFHVEIAKVHDVVSDPILGEMRLQWWRESVEGLFEGAPRQHEVVLALRGPVERGLIARNELDALIDARAPDLYDEQPQTLEDLESYLLATSGGIQRLAVKALGGGDASQHAAEAVGLAWGLTGIMRALPYHVSQNRIYIPRAMMEAAGLTNPARPEGEQKAALAEILKALDGRARDHIAAARERAGDVDARVRGVLRLAPLAEGYLKTLAKAGYDPESADYQRGALGRQCRLTLSALRRGY